MFKLTIDTNIQYKWRRTKLYISRKTIEICKLFQIAATKMEGSCLWALSCDLVWSLYRHRDKYPKMGDLCCVLSHILSLFSLLTLFLHADLLFLFPIIDFATMLVHLAQCAKLCVNIGWEQELVAELRIRFCGIRNILGGRIPVLDRDHLWLSLLTDYTT
jgi:hypothetical protein